MLIIAPEKELESQSTIKKNLEYSNAPNNSFQEFSRTIKDIAKKQKWDVTCNFTGNKERIKKEIENSLLVHFEVHSSKNKLGQNQGLEIGLQSRLNLKDIETIGTETLSIPQIAFLNA